ncbi:MAG: hypothetical protein ACRC92_13375 [Peptostreptococcaceae bacterium]
MKKSNKGFIAVECILSLAIISLAVYIVSSALYDSYNIVNRNAAKLEMLNIAKSNLEKLRYEIKYNKATIENNRIENEYGYDIIKVVEKEEEYYQCYKINVEVKNERESINLTTYVLQQ